MRNIDRHRQREREGGRRRERGVLMDVKYNDDDDSLSLAGKTIESCHLYLDKYQECVNP